MNIPICPVPSVRLPLLRSEAAGPCGPFPKLISDGRTGDPLINFEAAVHSFTEILRVVMRMAYRTLGKVAEETVVTAETREALSRAAYPHWREARRQGEGRVRSRGNGSVT